VLTFRQHELIRRQESLAGTFDLLNELAKNPMSKPKHPAYPEYHKK